MGRKEKNEQEAMQKIKDDLETRKALDTLGVRLVYANNGLYVKKNANEEYRCNIFGVKNGTIDMISARAKDFNIVINIARIGSELTYSTIMFQDIPRDKKTVIRNQELDKPNDIDIVSKIKGLFMKKKDRQ